MSSISPVRRSPLVAIAIGASWLAAVGAFLAVLAKRIASHEFPQGTTSGTTPLLLGSVVLAIVFWTLIFRYGNRLGAWIGTDGLALIGAVSALHFTCGVFARIGGQLLQGLMGPTAVYIHGIGDEGIPCLLTALLVVLRPKPGTVTFSFVTMFLLMIVTSGTFGLTTLLFVSLSIVLHELALAGLGVTVGTRLRQPRPTAPLDVVLRVALAIGAANSAALYAQFTYARLFSRWFVDPWYMWSVAGVSGLLYGSLGAALGVIFGYRLRRIAP